MPLQPLPPLTLDDWASLDWYRLDRDWTWEQMSDAMREAGYEVSPRTLHYLLTRPVTRAKAHDRTIHKIRKFIATIRASSRRQQQRKTTKANGAAASV